MKKVCHLTTVHPYFDIRIFHKEAKSLLKAGYDITLIAQHNKDEIVNGIKIIALPKPKNRIERMLLLSLKAFFKAIKQKADVYHFHDPELIIVGLFLKLMGKKVIYDIHEDVPKTIMSKYWIPKWIRSYVGFIVNLIEKGFSRYFDAVITATDDIAKNFKNHPRALVIKNYPLLEYFTNARVKNKNTNNYKIIYIGGLTPERGITQIVQAMEFLDNNARLILAGKFSPGSYENEVRSLEGFKKVDYLGWVDFTKVTEVYENANVGVICLLPEPNYINALPIKLFEYMAAKLPVIASNFPLWKEIVEGNNCGICVNPLNPKEIANAIKYLMEHPEEAKRMGENGRKAVFEKYNWENEEKKLIDLYEKILSS